MTLGLTQTPEGSYQHPRDPGEFAYGNAIPRMSTTDAEGELLARWSAGKRVIEIGTGLGVSTRALAKLASLVLTVDNDPWVQQEIWPRLMLERPNVETRDWVPPVGIYDVAFVDGDHRAEGLKCDIERVQRACLADALLIFHDMNYSNVATVVQDVFPAVQIIPTAHGLGVVLSNGKPAHVEA